jgi:hypothetical protein
MTSLGHPERF